MEILERAQMKERILDILKWAVIILIAGVAFYVLYPKYHFHVRMDKRGNKITGVVEKWDSETGRWIKR